MPNIDLKRENIPFWSQGSGAWNVHVTIPNLTEPLPPSDTDLISLGMQVSGGQAWQFGGAGNVKLGFDASTNARLVPLWASSSALRRTVLEEYGLEQYFASHPNDVLLVLQLGAQANANVTGKFTYSFLSASATVKAGADGGYALLRAYPASTPTEQMVRDFFKAFRLPAEVQALASGEVIAFEYGGYLDFKANLGAGYEISGAPSITLGQLRLAEKYDFSVAAKLSLGASLAGRFKVTVREGAQAGWARVTVSRSRSNSFSVAADVKATATLETEGLPDSADDFLSAVIGLKAKNWLNLFQQVRTLTDFPSLEKYLDNLAKSFIEEYTGKAFDALADHTQFDEWLAKINRVTDAYVNLGNHAVTLFDRYFNPVTKLVDDKLLTALNQIKAVTSWDKLKGRIDPILWDVVQHLTDGDPLGWMLGEVTGLPLPSPAAALVELQTRVDKVFALIHDTTHQEIRDLIALAQSSFPLNHFITELNDITWPQLRAETEQRLTGFVERVIGQTIKDLSNSDLGKAVNKFHEALDAIEDFKKTAYDKFTAALNQSFQFNLQAAYSRSTERDALLDFELDLTTEEGRHLMHEAGHGRFQDVLEAFDTGAVKLREGLLTHRVTRETRVAVNIVGWHTDWHYQGLDRLIVEADQRLESGNGQLTITTTVDLKSKHEQKRNGERVATNLLLRFFGESNGKLEFDEQNEQYLVDAITRLTARYDLVFDDPQTTPQELAQYLSFADDFGLTGDEEELIQRLENQLPTDTQGNFGATTISYDVRFTIEGLKALFKRPFTPADEAFVRRTMRLMVLANYLRKNETLAQRAWCYWSREAFTAWVNESFASFTSSRSFTIDPSPFRNLQAPISVKLQRTELLQLDTLYSIESSMVKGLKKLTDLLQTPGKLKPRDFEQALGDFGKVLKLYDDFDEGENTIFAVLDRLIQRTGGAQRNSSLTLTAKLGDQEVTQTLLA